MENIILDLPVVYDEIYNNNSVTKNITHLLLRN